MKKQETLSGLFFQGLQDIYSIEKFDEELLDGLSTSVFDAAFSALLSGHVKLVSKRIERLEKVFQHFKLQAPPASDNSMFTRISREIHDLLGYSENSPSRDSAFIIHYRKILHLEISVYSSLIELCDVLGYHRVGDMLSRSLDEEEEMDHDLGEIFRKINDEAFESDQKQPTRTQLSFSSEIHNPIL